MRASVESVFLYWNLSEIVIDDPPFSEATAAGMLRAVVSVDAPIVPLAGATKVSLWAVPALYVMLLKVMSLWLPSGSFQVTLSAPWTVGLVILLMTRASVPELRIV